MFVYVVALVPFVCEAENRANPSGPTLATVSPYISKCEVSPICYYKPCFFIKVINKFCNSCFLSSLTISPYKSIFANEHNLFNTLSRFV